MRQTAVNTAKENGVVVKFQKVMSEKGCKKSQFVACQHHILDLILRHIMDFQLEGSTRSLQLPYDFINEITNNYKVLKANYEHDSEVLFNENPGWRDDLRFLYQLCVAFKLNKETCKWPKNSMEKPSSSSQRQVELSWFICSYGLLSHIEF